MATNMIYFTSDLHLFHKNILRFTPNTREVATLDAMHNTIRDNWNAIVTNNDDVYILGDVSFGSVHDTFAFLRSLRGKKHLIYGNHDKLIRNSMLLQDCFASVQDYLELRYDNKLFALSHYPMIFWNQSNHGSYHLFGHMHGSLPSYGRAMDVGLDTRDDLRIYAITEILEALK